MKTKNKNKKASKLSRGNIVKVLHRIRKDLPKVLKSLIQLKETKDIWSILKKIDDQHKVRVENKQAEVFNYLNNIVNELLPNQSFKEVNELSETERGNGGYGSTNKQTK